METLLIFYAPVVVVVVSIAVAFYIGLKDGPIKNYEK